MAYSCPHCQTEIKGVTTEETVKARVDAKEGVIKARDGEIRLLKEDLVKKKALAASAETLQGERDTAIRDLADYQSKASRTATMRGLGIDTSTDDGAGVESSFQALHASAVAGLEEKSTFEQWIADAEGARLNPLLAHYFEGIGENEELPAAAAATGTPKRRGLLAPDNNTRTAPIVRAKLMTPAQLKAHTEGMGPKEYREWHQEHGKEYGAPPLHDPPKDPTA